MHPTVCKATIPYTQSLSGFALICMALPSFPNSCIPTQSDTMHVKYTHPTAATISHHPSTVRTGSLLIVRKQSHHFNKMDTGSVLLFLAVAAVILFAPLFMGPVHPPALPLLLALAIILGAVWIALKQGSK
ncbi:hypothetical protein ACFX1X_013066 [Malus domestica]